MNDKFLSAATIGFFDGVHCGHQYLIDEVKRLAQARGLKSMVITFDQHPRQVLQADYVPQLLTTTQEKVQLLQDLGVDHVEVLHFTPQMAALSAQQFMQQVLKERLGVRLLLIGYDHRFGHNRAEGFEQYVQYGREMGIDVVQNTAYTSPDGIRVSSSVVRRLLTEGDVAMAARCLGRPYQLQGTVAHGFAEGRKMGFPTANLDVSGQSLLIPARGVYAVRVGFGNEACVRPAMLNIGQRPTFGGLLTTIEAHVFHFNADVYGQPMRVAFVDRLRQEQRFDSVEALERQLAVDQCDALRVLGEE